MPSFQCQVCATSFDVAQAVIDKYPGWQPRFCREHSPKKKTRSGGGRRGASSSRGRRAFAQEENLTLAGVLEKYDGGPQTGVFTDGSAAPNPGPGGWGFVWVQEGEVLAQRYGHEAATTNNRMELMALIEAYRLLPQDASVTLLTDSRLCVQTINDWAPGWERRGWVRKGGPIKNLELVQELLELHRAHGACSIEWIAAHSGNRWNEYADSLATAWQRDEL